MKRAERGLAWALVAVLAVGLVAARLLPPVVLVLSVPFAVLMARAPVLRRLAVRNAARRPHETLLILLGALLGTAIITGSAVVGDTLDHSIRRTAFTQLGPIDQLVASSGLEQRDAIVAAVEQAVSGDPRVDGVLPMLSISAAVATTGDDPQAEPFATVVEVDFERAASFGGDAGATGISGATPDGDRVALGEDLAEALDVGPGGQVVLYAYGAERVHVVDRVLPKTGIAGFTRGFGTDSNTVFVPPGTLASLSGARPAGAAPPTSFVAVSNRGGVLDGASLSDPVTVTLTGAVEGMPASVSQVKKQVLAVAEEQGQQFTELFTSLGFFSVIAGILLLVNIFVMLAQERTTELGMLRAVGLRRRGLVGFFSLEGWIYSVAAAALGALAGLGVGWLIILFASRIFASGGLEVTYAAELSSVTGGFTFGFVLSLITVVATSLWISRLNVIAAIRDLPSRPGRRSGVLRLIAGAVLVLLGGVQLAQGISTEDPMLLIIGPALLAAGLVALLLGLLPRRPLISVASAGVLVWSVLAFDLMPGAFRNPEVFLFVVDGVTLSVFAVVLVSQNQELIAAAVRRLGGRTLLPVRLGLAYPLARRVRTGLILAMFTLVVFTLTSITLFSSVFQSQIDDFAADVSGGFDLRVFSNANNPIPAEAVAGREGVEIVEPISIASAEFRLPSVTGDDFDGWPVAGIGPGFLEAGPPGIDEGRLAPGEEPIDLWARLLGDPNAVIVNEFFLQNGGGPPEGLVDVGDRLVVRNPRTGATRELTVIGLADANFDFGPAFMAREAVKEFFGDQAVENLLYVATAPGVDPQEVAESINGAHLANGADAVSFRKSVQDNLAQQTSFFRLMQGYLAMGLVVGIAGIGVVMIRAVRERRREIGVLRSLGFDAVQVRRAFMTESAFVALEGIVIGVALSLVTTWRLLDADAFGDGLEFRVPWGALAVILLLSFGATVLATFAPAQQASRIRPAVALRIVD